MNVSSFFRWRPLIVQLLVLGGAAGATQAAPPEGVRTEVMHYWTSGGEAKAMAVIAAAWQARGGRWVDTAVAGGDALRTLALTRIQGGTPPTAMMWSVGAGLDELAQRGLLNPVTDVASAGGWSKLLPPAVMQRATVGREVYAVPLNVHGENWLYTSSRALAAAGLAPPASWSELIAQAPKIRAAGYIPLAVGGQPWQQVLLLRAIFASQGGNELYRRVFVARDPAATGSAAVRTAFETLAQLKPLTDAGSPGRNWNDTTNLLIAHKAVFHVMGDWARGEFVAAGLVAGRDYQCALPPGPGNGLIIATDVVVFPKTKVPAQIDAQRRLAALLLDRQVQIDFNRAKGSLSVRNDIGAESLDACGAKAVAILADPDRQLPNAALALSDETEGALEDLVGEYWNARKPDAAQATRRFADLLKAPR